MDKDFNEIDHIFNQRFDGLKDYSISPNAGWEKFNQKPTRGLNRSSNEFIGTSTLGSRLAFAASIGLLVAIGSSDNFTSNQSTEEIVARTSKIKVPTKELSNASESVVSLTELNPNIQTTRKSIIEHPTRSSTFNSDIESTTYAFSVVTPENIKVRESLAFMPDLKDENYFNEIKLPEDRGLVEGVQFAGIPHRYFLRSGINNTNGQSNSSEKPGLITTDGFIAFGGEYLFSEKWSINSEVGWLRRNGNAIERSRVVENNTVNTLFSGTLKANATNQNADIKVKESLIATSLDYIHVPLNASYHIKRSALSIGAFGEWLIRAKNDSYMVYNETEYVQTSIGEPNNVSLEGLRRLRYGVQFGFEKWVTSNFSFSSVAMMPLNSTATKSSIYNIPGTIKENVLVNVQFGLKYAI